MTYIVLILCISNLAGSLYNIRQGLHKASLGRRYIGWCSAIISVTLFISYLEMAMQRPNFIYYSELLSNRNIFTWTVVSNLFYLYPLLEYRADLISKRLFIIILHPSLVLGIIFFCVNWLEYPFIKLTTWNDVVSNIQMHDVQFRLLLLLFTFVVSVTYLYLPVLISRFNRELHIRRFSKWYYSFFVVVNLLIILYLPFSLIESPGVKVVFRLLLMLILNSITYSYMIPQISLTILRREKDSSVKKTFSTVTDYSSMNIYKTMHLEIEKNKYYLNSGISIDELAELLNTTRQVITNGIAKMDYNGYYEYMNTFRINHFKELAKSFPEKPISELYTESGFVSLSGFNRVFQQMESVSPKEYINKLIQESKTLSS